MTDIHGVPRDSVASDTLASTGVAQGAFIGHLVHELRNLLAPMGNVAQLIRMRSAEDTRLAPATAMLERQIGSVGRLLEKLAAADHLLREDTTLQRTPVDLRLLLDEALASTREALERRPRHLQVNLPETPVMVAGSAPHLDGVLRDVLDNATRYTRDDGHIRVTLDVQGGQARVRVSDDGCGIAPDRLPHVFTPRCLSPVGPPADRGGLGLSLATAARVLALHDGRIECQSAGPGAGSEFTLYLPLYVHDAAAREPTDGAQAESASLAARRVLVVDDSEAMQDSLTNLLEELGQQVRSARDGEEAVRIAQDWRPDLVLLDINLPKMNGYRVAQALRARFPSTQLSMVMMAGDELVDAVRRGASEVGVDRCIDKMQAGLLMQELLAAAPAR